MIITERKKREPMPRDQFSMRKKPIRVCNGSVVPEGERAMEQQTSFGSRMRLRLDVIT